MAEEPVDVTAVPELIRGRTWQELPVGFAFRTSSRTVTESDLMAFVSLHGFTLPLFGDARESLAMGVGGRLVPPALTFGLAEGLVVQTNVLYRTGMAFVSMTMEVKSPVVVGDTITVLVEITASKPLPHGGRALVTSSNRVVTQAGREVLVYTPVRVMAGDPEATEGVPS